jgi:DNA-binding MarR family transcriptional regulator
MARKSLANQTGVDQLPKLEGDYFVTEFVPYIMNNITNTMNQRFKKSLKKFKLNVSQWRVLAALSIKSDVSLTDLGQFTSIDQPSLSRIVDQLVERDLMTRIPRALSPKGKGLRDAAWPLAVAHSQQALAGLTTKEQETLRLLLKKLMASLA